MNLKTTLGATLLISGCCIGAGMIGLPVLSALAGFMPSSLAMLFCYFFTTATGLLLLEATLWFDKEVNLLSIVEFSLGKTAKFFTLILFLFLFYCLFVAYLDGGGMLFAKLLGILFHCTVPREIGVATCVGFVAALTFAGTRAVDGLNRGLIIGLILSYCMLVLIGLPQLHAKNLQHINLKATLATVPILLICFGYQNLVPSLTYYLKKNVSALRIAIIIGNLIPFFVYLLWNFVILGLLPTEYRPATHDEVNMVTELLQGHSQYITVLFFINAFSLFAILTSFLPSAISFMDFLKDGLSNATHINLNSNLLLCTLIFIPPFICTLIYPDLFLHALGFAGGFIDVLLFAVLPSLVVLNGRYFKKISGPYQVMGGGLTPALVLVLSVGILFIKIG